MNGRLKENHIRKSGPSYRLKHPSAESIWNNAKALLQQKLGPDTYRMWFHPTVAQGFNGDTLILAVQNEFCQVWLQDNYLQLLQDSVTIAAERKIKIRFSIASKIKEQEADRTNPLKIEIDQFNYELIDYLKKQPDHFYKISPRKFEEVVGEILRDLGCEIEITPETRDGGRDILAAFPSPAGKLLAIVECKRFSPNRKIGIDLVERFLWVMDNKDKASCGLLVTTTFFSPEAKALENELKYKLKLRDFNHLKQWIANYGNLTEKKQSGLWLPPTFDAENKS